jgi:hypothetical protein
MFFGCGGQWYLSWRPPFVLRVDESANGILDRERGVDLAGDITPTISSGLLKAQRLRSRTVLIAMISAPARVRMRSTSMAWD